MTAALHFIPKVSKQWEDVHSCISSSPFCSVTNFIDFIGEGYNSRASLFSTTPKNLSDYTKTMFAYGHSNEIKAKSLFAKKYSSSFTLLEEEIMKDISLSKDRLLGTPDGFLYSQEFGLGILEIKCPYGNKYGRDQEIEKKFEENPKRWKHWIQLQLYLWITGYNYGILAYYYPYGGENGEQLLICSLIKREEEIEEMLQLKENVNLFFQIQSDRSLLKKINKKEDHGITTERISRGIIQRLSLQE